MQNLNLSPDHVVMTKEKYDQLEKALQELKLGYCMTISYYERWKGFDKEITFKSREDFDQALADKINEVEKDITKKDEKIEELLKLKDELLEEIRQAKQIIRYAYSDLHNIGFFEFITGKYKKHLTNLYEKSDDMIKRVKSLLPVRERIDFPEY